MATIKDVAAEAGVAISTVSKVLNDYPGVSGKTKEKVNNAVKRLGFTPNTVAAALSSKRSGRIALLMNMHDFGKAFDEINMRYLSGAIESALENGLDVVTVFFSMIEGMDADSLTSYLRAQSIEGIIIFGMSKKDSVLAELIDRQTFKTVIVDAPIVNAAASSIGIDYEQAQIDVVMKTLENVEGCRILYIAGGSDSFETEGKLRAVARLEEDLNTNAMIFEGNFSEVRAREIVFEHATEADIIVCASDLMAIGAMRALMEMDIFKPVCGFDGIMLMAYAGKQMNTVKVNFEKHARLAVAEVKRLMYGGEGQCITTDYELVRMEYKDALI